MAEETTTGIEDLSPEEMAMLEAILAEEEGTPPAAQVQAGEQNIENNTPGEGAPGVPPVTPQLPAADPRMDALLQRLDATQSSISSMLQNQTAQQEQSNSALQQLLNPRPEINPEEAALQQMVQSSVAPLQEQNQQLLQRIQQMEIEAQKNKAAEFNAQQRAALTAVKSKYPDFDPAVAGATMQPFINTLVDMGMDETVAMQVVMKQFGNESGLELIWRAKKFDDVMSKAKKQRPDTHIPTSNAPAKPNSIMEQLTSEDENLRANAINDLWKV